jgi:hypothetical protein
LVDGYDARAQVKAARETWLSLCLCAADLREKQGECGSRGGGYFRVGAEGTNRVRLSMADCDEDGQLAAEGEGGEVESRDRRKEKGRGVIDRCKRDGRTGMTMDGGGLM